MGRRYRKLGEVARGATNIPTRNRGKRALVLSYEERAKGIKRKPTRYDGDTPNRPIFTVNETWGALKRCWLAYKIATKDRYGKNLDEEKALKYARRIRKLQFELDIEISEFPELGLYGTGPEDVDLTAD